MLNEPCEQIITNIKNSKWNKYTYQKSNNLTAQKNMPCCRFKTDSKNICKNYDTQKSWLFKFSYSWEKTDNWNENTKLSLPNGTIMT